MDAQGKDDEYMTLEEAAGRYGISAARLRQMILAGQLRSVQFGQAKNRPHLVKPAWVAEARAASNPGGRGRPAKRPPAVPGVS